jgi:hypothetical protein
MEKLNKSQNTTGTDAAFDLLGRIAVDPATDRRYPSETVLVPADSPNASTLMTDAVAEERPIAIVFPDGSDVVWRPPDVKGLAFAILVGVLWVAEHIRRKRDRPTFVPREWVTEFHAASSSTRPKVAA